MAKNLPKPVLAAVLLGLAMTLSACGTMFGEDYSEKPEYKAGYSAGCGTGTGYVPGNSATVIRDPELWNTNKAYRAGWKAGFNSCRASTTNAPGAGEDMGRGRRNGPSGY